MGIYVLFLSLVRKKKLPKRKDPVCTSVATADVFQPKGQKLASLRQACPFLRLKAILRFTPLQ